MAKFLQLRPLRVVGGVSIAAGAVALAAVSLAATAATAAPKTPTPHGTGAVTRMYQYEPGGAANQPGTFGFLGTPPAMTFTSKFTTAEVTGTVDLASASGGTTYSNTVLGVCYQKVGTTAISATDAVFPEFYAGADAFFAQTVSGVVGGLARGSYRVGLCAADQSNVLNGEAAVTIILTQATTKATLVAAPAVKQPLLHQ